MNLGFGVIPFKRWDPNEDLSREKVRRLEIDCLFKESRLEVPKILKKGDGGSTIEEIKGCKHNRLSTNGDGDV